MKAHTAVNLLTGLVVTCTYCSLPAPFVQQRTLTYQVPEQNEALGLLVIWHLKSVAFIRLTLKPKHTQCFSNICLQRIFCLNSILPLSGVSNPATGCIFYRNGLIHHRDETPPPRQTIQLKISTRSVFFFFWGGHRNSFLMNAVKVHHLTWRHAQLQAAFVTTSVQKDVSRGRGGHCEINRQGKSLRFNVGWQWVDISLTATEC